MSKEAIAHIELMPTGDDRFIAVRTGSPEVRMLACVVCGVILWDADKHYAITHPSSVAPEPSADDAEALALLDSLNESGRIAYADYFALHDAISALIPEPPADDEMLDAAVSRCRSRTSRGVAAYQDDLETIIGAAYRHRVPVTDDAVAAALDARAGMSSVHCYLYATEKCRCGQEWTDAHWMRYILEAAEAAR